MKNLITSPLLAANYLRLIIMPEEQCNLRCNYCYEDFENRRMKRPVVDGLKRLISMRSSTLDLLQIDWFGGEPLLAIEVVEEVQEHAQREGDTHRFQLRGAMTTNATLLDQETFLRLIALGVTSYQISLDGPQELHDSKRTTGGGQPTFDIILKNLEELKRSDGNFDVLVRLNVDRENLEATPEFLEDLSKSFGSDERFRFFIRELARLGGPNDKELCILEPSEEEEHLSRLRGIASDLGLRQEDGEPKPCYAAAANAWVVRSTGDLAKCTVALSDPKNRIGRLLESGELEVDEEVALPWIRGIWSKSAEELICPADELVENRKRSTAVLPILANAG